ncbi:MAG: S8 family serine peptidase [Vicinamibacteria bacterium]
MPARRKTRKRQRLKNLQKADPKLRVIANGSDVVNTLRAERSAALRVTDAAILKRVSAQRDSMDRPIPRTKARGAKRGHLKQFPDKVEASVFVRLLDPLQTMPEDLRGSARGRRQDLVAATVTVGQLNQVLQKAEVTGVELAERVTFSPPLDVAPVAANELSTKSFDPGKGRSGLARHRRPKKNDVLVGIIDVQGFDFAHPDFLKNGKTRFVAIWDQGGDTRDPPQPKGIFNYGAEITEKHLNAALKDSRSLRLPAYVLEPQSQMTVSSHATHVASIAAGLHGICPDATIAGVLINLPREDQDRRRSFYDSTRIAHALDYLLLLGEKLGVPVSINISLGTNGHAHDGTSGLNRWIDYALATPGTAVSVAAGNAGQEAPIEPGDWGYMVGRIHTSGRFAGSGLTRDIQWIVMGDGVADLSENELEIWYAPQDRFEIMLRPPGSPTWIGPLQSGEYVENRMLADGTFVSIYNERYHPANGNNCISIYLSPFLSPGGVVGVKAGTWTVRLIGSEVRDGTYHAWIERDDPRRLGRAGMKEAWSFPSFFSKHSNVDQSSVSSLACGEQIISVANLDADREVMNVTSSQGPTRDGREKPEIAAPGTGIVAANGFDPENLWVRMSGTSMSSPYVAGVVALMLQMDPELTAAQITGILRRTAQPLPGTDFNWRDDAGYGAIQPRACLDEVGKLRLRRDRTKS